MPRVVAALFPAAVAAAAIGLGAAGVLPRWPGLLHAVALPPLDVGFDLRVLVARAPSYPLFLLGVVASLAVRSFALAGLVRAFGGPWAPGRAAKVYAAAVLPLTLGAGLEFAGLAALYHWYVWTGLAIVLVTFVVVAPILVRRPDDEPRPLAARSAAVAAALVGVAGLGAAARGASLPTTLAAMGGSAAITAIAVATLLARPRALGRRGSAARAVIAVAVLMALLAPALARGEGSGAPSSAQAPEPVLFLVPGVDTATGVGTLYRFDPGTVGVGCDRVYYYSYLGRGTPRGPSESAACPVRYHEPYLAHHTQAPLEELVRAFSDQLEIVRLQAGGAPIVVLTHSQGAWIAWRAVTSGRAAGVSAIVMLGAVPRTAVGYPPSGSQGPGRVGGDILRLVAGVAHQVGVAEFDPDAPLAEQMLARDGAIERLFASPLPEGVRGAIAFASFDAAVAPGGWELPGVTVATIDATHTGVVGSPDAARFIRRFLGRAAAPSTSGLARALSRLLPAFEPPPIEA